MMRRGSSSIPPSPWWTAPVSHSFPSGNKVFCRHHVKTDSIYKVMVSSLIPKHERVSFRSLILRNPGFYGFTTLRKYRRMKAGRISWVSHSNWWWENKQCWISGLAPWSACQKSRMNQQAQSSSPFAYSSKCLSSSVPPISVTITFCDKQLRHCLRKEGEVDRQCHVPSMAIWRNPPRYVYRF